MGRLNKSESTNTLNSISGETIKDVHIFIDEFGNVTQIEKKDRDTRLKYYIDPALSQLEYVSDCVIGINDATDGDCSYGIGLGIGDNTFARINY